ncbi:MAG: phosphatidylserine decarboxylase, partial [Betaproteobacteria bacterium]|nr:phosphatidylserine decarboxylase [Betaproteobacteria bacterium]
MVQPLKRRIADELNFILTNRIPRIALTHFMGWFASIQSPVLTKLSVWIWKLFADLDLREAKHTQFASLRDCFIRELREGLRPIDSRPGIWTSPCDAIVGACGRVQAQTLFQTKGLSYRLEDLLGDRALADQLEGAPYVTLRLLSSMYHRFHAPADAVLRAVTYHSGDVWNVNPIALARVPGLFCRNERAVLRFSVKHSDRPLVLVPVAAVLVASMRIHAIDQQLSLRYQGPHHFDCEQPCSKGEELGWFEHGSTILV